MSRAVPNNREVQILVLAATLIYGAGPLCALLLTWYSLLFPLLSIPLALYVHS